MSERRPKISGEIVRDWSEFGHRFQIEKLDPPVLRGAGLRYYRLWHNTWPCKGWQWCYDIESAKSNANYVLNCYYGDKVRKLEQRNNELQRRQQELLVLLRDIDSYDIPLASREILVEYIEGYPRYDRELANINQLISDKLKEFEERESE